MAQDVIEALEQPGFGRIRDDWTKWSARKDLFDHVVMKSVDFIAGFINQVVYAKTRTLAALFIKRPDEVDQVLKRIKYNDGDLIGLTSYRPELAESHDKFFKVIDKIKDPEDQEWAVERVVFNLFKAKQHGSVISLINALEKRHFNNGKLKNVATREAFDQGAKRSIKHIVEELHEHTAITSDRYASGLTKSWENDKSKMVFSFLLTQADQGDLGKAKEHDNYEEDLEFRKAIDDAFPRAEPAGSRHARFLNKERVRLAKEAFSEFPSTNLSPKNGGGPEDIIFDYILG